MDENYGLIYRYLTDSVLPNKLRNILEDSWVLNIKSSEEWESNSPIGIADVTAYDSEGEEIEIPKCPKCDVYMSQVIGKKSFQWICMSGCK